MEMELAAVKQQKMFDVSTPQESYPENVKILCNSGGGPLIERAFELWAALQQAPPLVACVA